MKISARLSYHIQFWKYPVFLVPFLIEIGKIHNPETFFKTNHALQYLKDCKAVWYLQAKRQIIDEWKFRFEIVWIIRIINIFMKYFDTEMIQLDIGIISYL